MILLKDILLIELGAQLDVGLLIFIKEFFSTKLFSYIILGIHHN